MFNLNATYYSPKEKANAMQVLVENMGNTRITSQQTGIPERTLRRWRSEYQPITLLIADSREETLENAIRQEYVQIRNGLIAHVQRVSKKMNENPETTADLALEYVRLIDRLIKAEQLASARSFKLVILWEGPEAFAKLSNKEDEIQF